MLQQHFEYDVMLYDVFTSCCAEHYSLQWPLALPVWWQTAKSTVGMIFRHSKFRLLVPLLVFNGFEQGFIYADYTKVLRWKLMFTLRRFVNAWIYVYASYLSLAEHTDELIITFPVLIIRYEWQVMAIYSFGAIHLVHVGVHTQRGKTVQRVV